MASVRAADTFHGTVHEAELCWYDVSRWPAWVDGLSRVVALAGEWPQPGSIVTWESGPAGRGTVRERVTAHEPLAGVTLEVEDDSISATEWIEFTPADGEVQVRVTLEYAIKRRSIVTPLVDALFIRRLIAASLRRTLTQFGAELESSRSAAVG
jgi:Polyketide cyclase / dehydrase and lipid transport